MNRNSYKLVIVKLLIKLIYNIGKKMFQYKKYMYCHSSCIHHIVLLNIKMTIMHNISRVMRSVHFYDIKLSDIYIAQLPGNTISL